MTIVNLPAVSAGKTDKAHFNNVQDAITGDIYPRDSSGTAESGTQDLGSSSAKWISAYVQVGYVPTGTIMPWYDYAGTIPMPQGWFLCDGSIINKANYDSQHSTGDWDKYVGSSAFDGLYSLDTNDKFLKGYGTTEDGVSAPPTTYGNPSHVKTLDHGHTVGITVYDEPSPQHQRQYSAGGPNNFLGHFGSGGTTHGHSGSTMPDHTGTIDLTPVHTPVKFLIKIVE